MNDQEKIEKIKAIYKEYLAKISVLEHEQDGLIRKFVKENEHKQIEDIKKELIQKYGKK